MPDLAVDINFDTDVTGYSDKEWYISRSFDLDPTYPKLDRNENLNEVFGFSLGVDDSSVLSVEDDQFNNESIHDLEKKCDDRLTLLARAYAQNTDPERDREIRARLEIIESVLDREVPRYSVEDWQLLKSFEESIQSLEQTIEK